MKTPEEIMEIALNGLLAEKAHDDLGIYPRAIKGGPNAYEERGDYQNGWNAAVMAYTHKMVVFESFLNSLDERHRKALQTLMFDEAVMLAERDDKVNIWLCVNDTFYYAADAEDVSVDDLPLLAELYEKYDWYGLIAWVGWKRDMEPLKTKCKFLDKDEYKSAVDFFRTYDGNKK